jgi:hypothetical protein
MRALRLAVTFPILGMMATLSVGCGPSGGAEGTPPVATAKPGEPAKGPAPTPAPAPVDKKFQEEAMLIAAEVGKLPPSPAAAAEGLEAAEGWKLAGWEDPGASRKVEIGRGGNALMHLATAGGPQGKSALLLTRDMALAEKGAMRLAIYNPGATPVRVAVAFWFSDGWVYYESKPQDVESRAWKTLAFDLAAADFKTASSKWEYSAGLWKRTELKQLGVLLFAGGKPGAVFVDGIAVDLGAAPAPAAKPDPAAGRPGPGPGQGPGRRPRPGQGPAPEKKTDDPKAEKKDEPKVEKKVEPPAAVPAPTPAPAPADPKASKPGDAGAKVEPPAPAKEKDGLFGQPPPAAAPAP